MTAAGTGGRARPATRVAAMFAAGGPPAAFAAKAATQATPVVFSALNDPVRLRLVASLNRPGGNLTGTNSFTVELLKELVPATTLVAYLVNPSNPSVENYVKEDPG
jgi:putative tryptophan/tyrosine transport system substrate-binding protein